MPARTPAQSGDTALSGSPPEGHAWPRMVVYRLLGALEASEGGVRADLGPPKQRALLAVLLLRANEIVSVDALVEELWGEAAPRRAQHAVQVYVSDLRRALAPLGAADAITWRSPGYVLAADPEAVDARRFERLVAEGARRAADGEPSAAAVLREALALWRGQPLADFAYEEFAQPAIRRLTEARLLATETLASVELAQGRATEALALAETAVREDPLREPAREAQMLALYRLGRHADALRAYEDLREALADEVGAEPSPRLRDLQERILLHDPSLPGVRRERAPEAPAAVRNPYKGLRPFGEEDASDFFGREALVGRLADALAAGSRLVALVGPSGSGKSSILHAGLVPRLRARDDGAAPGTVVTMRPGPHPHRALELALRAPGSRLVVVIDQLEELFAAGEAEIAALPGDAGAGGRGSGSGRQRRARAAGGRLRPAAPPRRVRPGLPGGRA